MSESPGLSKRISNEKIKFSAASIDLNALFNLNYNFDLLKGIIEELLNNQQILQDGMDKLNEKDILAEREKLTPLSTIMAEKITALRLWAKNRARIAGDEFSEKIEGEDSVVRLKSECYNPLLG